MNFSEPILHSGISTFSPNSQYLAYSKSKSIIIIETVTATLFAHYEYNYAVASIAWSPNSQHILCTLKGQPVAVVRSLKMKEWMCRIDEGEIGLANVFWVPDSFQVISISDFQIRLTIWSLTEKSSTYIQCPKFSDKGYCFTDDGALFGLIERSNGKDQIGVYHTLTWNLLLHFQLQQINAEGILLWSDKVIVWEQLLLYNVQIFDMHQNLLYSYTNSVPNSLGIRKVEKCQDYIAFCNYDEKLAVMNNKCQYCADFVMQNCDGVDVYKEESTPAAKYSIGPFPFKAKQMIYKDEKFPPPFGIHLAKWSKDGKYLSTVSKTYPSVVCVWSMSDTSLKACLCNQKPILSMAWNMCVNQLVFVCGNFKMYIWSSEGASICELPEELAGFQISKLEWCENGNYIAASDQTKIVLCSFS